MKQFIMGTALVGIAAATLAAKPAQAAPRQYIVVVSEGLSPQVLDLGKGYIRKADEDADATTAFDDIAAAGKSASATGVNDLKGLLAKAAASGYKTGLVTTASVASDAALFYGVAATAEGAIGAKADFLAGGGRAAFKAEATKAFTGAGNTYIENEEGVDTEIKGRVLALQADGDLSYAVDRSPETEAGLGELTSLAIDTLGNNNAPYVLIVHDTLIKKAIDTKDSPALFEQFREDGAILTDALSRRDDAPGLAVAALWTGGTTPKFNTAVDAEIGNSYFVLSKLGASYSGVGTALKGADAEKITAFIDPEDGVYRGWKLSAATRQGIIDGKVNAETAARASYEPVVKLSFDGPAAAAGATVVGFDAPQGIGPALQAAVAQAPAK